MTLAKALGWGGVLLVPLILVARASVVRQGRISWKSLSISFVTVLLVLVFAAGGIYLMVSLPASIPPPPS
jgi:hypothetical protein